MSCVETGMKDMNGAVKPNFWSVIQALKYDFYSMLTYRDIENEYLLQKKSVTEKEKEHVIAFFHVTQDIIILGNEVVIY